MSRPFPVIEKVGNAYRLKLPDSMKIHPIFAPEKSRKASSSPPLEGRIADPQGPIEIDGRQEWEVDAVLASRMHYGKLEYRVQWTGHDEDLAWYPARNFKGSPHCIHAYHEQYPDRPCLPKRLDAWLKAWGDGEELDDVDDDDRPLQLPASKKPRRKGRV